MPREFRQGYILYRPNVVERLLDSFNIPQAPGGLSGFVHQ